jgi:hypothetical protein
MMKVLLRDDILRQHGFKVRGTSIYDLHYTSAPNDAQLVTFIKGGPQSSVYGRRFVCISTNFKATVGGCILLDGGPFGLTVAHSFIYGVAPPSLHHMPIDECKIFDSDWAFDNTDDEESDLDCNGVIGSFDLEPDSGTYNIPLLSQSLTDNVCIENTKSQARLSIQEDRTLEAALISPPTQDLLCCDLD